MNRQTDRRLTVAGVQQAEQRVQKVADGSAQLFGGGVLHQLCEWLIGCRRTEWAGQAGGAQRHAQPLHRLRSQVQLELQLCAVMISRENTRVLFQSFIRFTQEVLSVVGAVERRNVHVLQEGFQTVTRQVVSENSSQGKQ